MSLSVNILIMRDELYKLRSPTYSSSGPAQSDRCARKRARNQLDDSVCDRDHAGPHFNSKVGEDVDIRCWISIAAETRRVFCAISTPEYIESWMEFSEQSQAVHWIHLGADDMLCIVREDSVREIRVCRFRIQKRKNSLKFLWESIDPSMGRTSTVDIVVKGAPHRCDLWVRHRGICHNSEKQFYTTMWRRSLYKLQGLLQ